MPEPENVTCRTCGREVPVQESRREPGWMDGDYDCLECYATWPEREVEALDRRG